MSLVGGPLWMVLGLAILAGAWRMDRFEAMGASWHNAPGLVPGVYGAVMVVLGAALLWRDARARRGPGPASASASASGSESASASASTTPGEGPLLNRRIGQAQHQHPAHAAAALGRVHFGLSTAVFVALFCWLYNPAAAPTRRVGVALFTGVATAVAVVLVFERVFLVRLP
jgi:Tripartite tricarboxylate transporter TctB family